MRSSRAAVVVPLLLALDACSIGSFGIGATDAQPADAIDATSDLATDATTESSAGFSIDPDGGVQLPSVGTIVAGTGHAYDMLCPVSDELVVQLTILAPAGYQVHYLAASCEHLRADGTFDPAVDSPVDTAGDTSAGGTRTDDACGPGAALVGIRGTTNCTPCGENLVAQIGAECASVSAWTSPDGGAITMLPLRGSPDGVNPINYESRCAPGYFVNGFTGNSGLLVDGIRVHCVPVR
jgi:hypothetical protein